MGRHIIELRLHANAVEDTDNANEVPAAFIAEASRRFGVATSWIHAARQAESGGEVHALSPEGAMGLLIAHLVSEAIVAYQHVSS